MSRIILKQSGQVYSYFSRNGLRAGMSGIPPQHGAARGLSSPGASNNPLSIGTGLGRNSILQHSHGHLFQQPVYTSVVTGIANRNMRFSYCYPNIPLVYANQHNTHVSTFTLPIQPSPCRLDSSVNAILYNPDIQGDNVQNNQSGRLSSTGTVQCLHWYPSHGYYLQGFLPNAMNYSSTAMRMLNQVPTTVFNLGGIRYGDVVSSGSIAPTRYLYTPHQWQSTARRPLVHMYVEGISDLRAFYFLWNLWTKTRFNPDALAALDNEYQLVSDCFSVNQNRFYIIKQFIECTK